MRLTPLILACGIFVCISFVVSAQDAPPDTLCVGAPIPRLIVNTLGEVVAGQSNNMRDLPAKSGTKMGEIPGGATFSVLEGPTCADGFNWWRVDYDGLVGWTVEGQGGEYWLQPAPTDNTSASQDTSQGDTTNPYRNPQFPVSNRLTIDIDARLQSPDGLPVALLASPDNQATTVEALPTGTIVRVLEEGTGAWWRVRADDGTEGWVKEGFARGGRASAYFATIAPLCTYTENRMAFAIITDGADSDLYTLGLDGRKLCNLTYGANLAFDGVYAWSPDGSALAFRGVSASDGVFPTEADLYVMSADGRNLTRLTTGQVVSEINWSGTRPDQAIAFLQQAPTDPNIANLYVINADGTNLRQLTPDAIDRRHLISSPDGTTLAFVHYPDSFAKDFFGTVTRIDPTTGEQTDLFASDWYVNSLAWRPDGQALLASVYINLGQNVLVEINAVTGAHTLIADDATLAAVYSHDGTRIAFWSLVDAVPRRLMVLERATGELTKLATLSVDYPPVLAWTPDDTALLVNYNGILRVDVATGQYENLGISPIEASNLVQPTAP